MFEILKLFLEFIYFFALVFILFYIPGRYVLSFVKNKIPYPADIFLSIVIGIVGFTLAQYLVAFLRLELLIYLILIIIVFLSFEKKISLKPKIPRNQKWPTIIVIVLSVIFSFQMIFNGNFGEGIYYFGDDLAHLGYISELRLGTFPYEHPATAGVPLRGYHFFYDFLIAKLSTTTYISHLSLYFHFMPLLVALGWGVGTYSLMYIWTKRVSAGIWGAFFVLFGTSFGYFLFLINHPNSLLSTHFGIDQPITALWNAPYSFSVVLILALLTTMFLYLKKKDGVLLVVLSVIVGVLPVFKVYAGILGITGLGVFVLYGLWKRNIIVLVSPLISFILVLITYLVFSGKGAGIFFLPLWPLERMVDVTFPEYGYKEKIRTYTEQNVLLGLFKTYAFASSLFILGNLGTRLIGILLLPMLYIKNKKLPSAFSLILFSMTIVSIGMPLIFAQTIKVFEMIQITWYYPLFVSFFSALGISFFLSLNFSKTIKIIFSVLVVLFTLPPILFSFYSSTVPLLLAERQPYSSDYYQATNFLKNNGTYNETVLELPVAKKYVSPRLVGKWFNHASAHIPAFAEKRSYLGNQFIVFPNMPVEERVNFIAEINRVEFAKNRKSDDVQNIINEIIDRKIDYIYTTGDIKIFSSNSNFKIVYRNPSTVIYEFQK